MDIIKMRWPRCWWEGEGFSSLFFYIWQAEKILPPLSSNVVTLSSANTQLRHIRILTFIDVKTTFLVHRSASRVSCLNKQPRVYPDKLGVKTFFQFKRQILFKDNCYKNDFEKLRPLEELRTTELNLSSSPIPVYTTVHPINHTQSGICSKNNKIINNIHFLFYINFSD